MGILEENRAMLKNMVGETIIAVKQIGGNGKFNADSHPTELVFVCDSGNCYEMKHSKTCCEEVFVEDGMYAIENLIGEKLISAEVASNTEDEYGTDVDGSKLKWTYYKFKTIKGYCDLRWVGTTHSVYDLSVNIEQIATVVNFTEFCTDVLYTIEHSSFEDYVKLSCQNRDYRLDDLNNCFNSIRVVFDAKVPCEEPTEDFSDVWIGERIISAKLEDGEANTKIFTIEVESHNIKIIFKLDKNDQKIVLRYLEESWER